MLFDFNVSAGLDKKNRRSIILDINSWEAETEFLRNSRLDNKRGTQAVSCFRIFKK